MKITRTTILYILFSLFFIGLFAQSQYNGYRWLSGKNTKYVSAKPRTVVIMHK